VGGTKINAGVVDEAGKIHGCVQVKTNATNPETALESINHAIISAITQSGFASSEISGVGVGIPGKIDPARGTATLSVNLGWRNTPVRTALEACVGLPCFVENDVKAATLGEWRYGAGRGIDNLVFLSIGTGIGAGLLINGKLHRGAHLIAGEIGQAIVDPSGPRDKCGARGCFEALASGPAIVRRAARGLSISRESSGSDLDTGESNPLLAREVFAEATRGNSFARQVLDETAFYIAYAVRWLITTVDPQLVILGGGVAESGENLLNAVRQELQRQADESWVFRDMYNPEAIRLSTLQTDAGILGAAALVEP
jgi:glucokinase